MGRLKLRLWGPLVIDRELLHEVGGEHNHWKRGGQVGELKGQATGRTIYVDTEITKILILRGQCWRR